MSAPVAGVQGGKAASHQDDERKGRGSITPAGSAAATSFLASRWRAIEAASADSKVPAAERPEILREKSITQTLTSTAGATGASQTGKAASGGQGQRGGGGSPWSGGRRH